MPGLCMCICMCSLCVYLCDDGCPCACACVHNPIHIDEIAEYCPASGSSANSPLGEGLRVAAFCDEDKGAGEAGDEDPSRQKR